MSAESVKQWRAWAIKRNRLDVVIKYIQEKCPEIDKYFYPQIKKEYETKSGETKVKDRPLYEGYLFLRYNNSAEVFHKLRAFPFITTFAGPVTDEEIERMQAAQGKLLSEIKASKYVPGDSVTLVSGPFEGFDGKVISVQGDTLRVKVEAPILGKKSIETIYTEEQVKHKTGLQNIEVKNV